MAYDTEKLFERAMKIADRPGVYFASDLIALLGISNSTFYDHFPTDSEKSNALKEKLNDNKVEMKLKLRQRLAEGEKAAEILALYKLIATDDERKALSMQHVDHTSKGDKINIPISTWAKQDDGAKAD